MRIYVAGIRGMVGSAISLEAKAQGHEVIGKTSKDLDLTDRAAVFKEIKDVRADCLIISAAKVGGIGANSSLPVDFLSINLQIQTNPIYCHEKHNTAHHKLRLEKERISGELL